MLPKKKKRNPYFVSVFKIRKNQLMIYIRKIKIEKQKKSKATNYSQKKPNWTNTRTNLVWFGSSLD